MIIERSAKPQDEDWKGTWHGFGITIETILGQDPTFMPMYYDNGNIRAQFRCDADFEEVEWSREDLDHVFTKLDCSDFKA